MIGVSKRHKLIAASLWVAALAAGIVYIQVEDISVLDMVASFYRNAQNHPWAAFTYVVLYALRPLTFFPAMWLTITSGSLFGFLPGVMLTIVGENLSAATAYTIARFFRAPPGEDDEAVAELSPFRRTLQEQALPTVIVLRAAYLPFDLVNFGCGLLRVPWWPYFFGTFIGILPPMITFVSFGASVDLNAVLDNPSQFDPASLFDTEQILVTLGLLVLSGIIAWYAHRRRRRLSRD